MVTFNNNSTCYLAGDSSPVFCNSYFWDFGNGVTSTSSGNPTTTYDFSGLKTVQLKVTDSASNSCSTTNSFYVSSQLPWWTEIVPF